MPVGMSKGVCLGCLRDRYPNWEPAILANWEADLESSWADGNVKCHRYPFPVRRKDAATGCLQVWRHRTMLPVGEEAVP